MASLKEAARMIEQRKAQKLARGRVVLELPIYEGEVAGRFGVLDDDALGEFEALVERGNVSRQEALDAGAQFIADACRGMLARTEPGGPYEPMTHDDGRPVLFDEEFAETFGLEHRGAAPTSSTDVVFAVFTTEDGDVNTAALNVFAIKLLGWMQNTAGPVEGEVVGGLLGGR